jgi:hypothetical protein
MATIGFVDEIKETPVVATKAEEPVVAKPAKAVKEAK